MRLAAWQIQNGLPARVDALAVQLEEHLETWIVQDPSLVQEGLRIVGRQVVLEGGRLDLLAVDPQGRWTLLEVKRGMLYRETLAQGLDYVSSISTMPSDKLRTIVEDYLTK